ncbi:MAG: hypothetical protein E7370_03195 [Clostridiales bacterium]|nr:hypothetical protein [Clostridiales bacterium]
MAEERLNDLDKDKKYRIRKNEDGEEELYFAGDEDEEEEEFAEFEVPEFAYDNEDMVTMTPEQLHAAMEEARVAEEKRAQKIEALKQSAITAMEEGDFVRAEADSDEGIITDETEGLFYCIKLRTLCSDFSDLSLLKDCADIADGVKKYATDEQKEQLLQISAGKLDLEYQKKKQEVAKIKDENEQKKAERRVKFLAKRNRSLALFLCFAVPFAISLILTIVFGSQMYAREDGLNLVLTIVFGAVAAFFAIFTVIFARFLVSSVRMVRLNERDTSTKLGRKFLEEEASLSLLERIYTAINTQN